MKRCFLKLEFIERFTWDDDAKEYISSEKQCECMSCHYFQRCSVLSLGRTVEKILVKLELHYYPSEGDDDNGDIVILDVEDN
jgi:hypothetical protein